MERIGVEPGTEVGGYRVIGPLGAGGMGAVYRAVDGHGTVVALKLLHPHLGAYPDARERLRREVAHLQRVRHPCVARVLDAEIESTEAFVVTELVEGDDLAATVRSRGPLPPLELADLAEQLRAALVVVHAAGVLHRDLTPGNVLVTDRGPVLIDFGIAQAADDARVTSTGLVMGTPGYLAPELLEGGEPSAAGDWWGWAALLAFAATGRPPFGVRPLHAVLARARAGAADLAGLDPRTTAALRRALAVDPAQRAGAEQVVAELRRAAEGDPGPPTTTSAWPAGATAVTHAVGPGGGTQVMPTTALGAGPPPPDDANRPPDAYRPGDAYAEEDRYDDGAFDEDSFDDDGGRSVQDEESQDAPQEYLPPEPRRRVGTLLALGAAVVALGAVRPGVAVASAVVLAALVRSVGRAVEAFHRSRSRRGVRRGDVARVVGGSPWFLVRGVVGVLPAALVAASIVAVVGGVAWWALDSGRLIVEEPAIGRAPGELEANAAWVTTAFVVGAVVLGLLAFWFGPMSRATRVGARWTLAALAPRWVGAVTVSVLALAVAALLLTLVTSDQEIVWWPLPGPPDLG